MRLKPEDKVEKLAGVGLRTVAKLAKLDIVTLEDLVRHFPSRYLDFSKISPISAVNAGQMVTIAASVWQIKNRRGRRNFFITNAILADESGTCEAVWFNKPYLTRILKPGSKFLFAGKLENYKLRSILLNAEYEQIDNLSNNGPIHTGRLVPVYSETEGCGSKFLRTKIAQVLSSVRFEEFLPKNTLIRQKLPELTSALSQIHFPKTRTEAEIAKKRFSFEELFLIEILQFLRKAAWKTKHRGIALKLNRNDLKAFKVALPFQLTAAQERAIDEILKDLSKDIPMNRLLEGDVGSGKTVVAALAAFATYKNHLKTILAAPTEILAIQHLANLTGLLAPFNIKVGLYTKSRKDRNFHILVGTHALIFTKRAFENVGLVVVDEQHRFGVGQRFQIQSKAANTVNLPHFLTMTATPIPRSLALTIFGDLDLSILDEKPADRLKVKTYIVPTYKRGPAYEFIKKQITAGNLTFIICPFVNISETLATVAAATTEFERLKKQVFADYKLGLLHGRLPAAEKERVLVQFQKGEIQILVATPVVEVGIDVPKASVMVIEGADRFGLAQLHQLRGRVGRTNLQSYCLLFSQNQSKLVQARLKSLEKIDDGAKLAEIDLKLRGPGEIFGQHQSGFGKLKLSQIFDFGQVKRTRDEALKILAEDANLKSSRRLAEKIVELARLSVPH